MDENQRDNSPLTREIANTINETIDIIKPTYKDSYATSLDTPALELQALKTLVTKNALQRSIEKNDVNEKTGLFSYIKFNDDCAIKIEEHVQKNPDGSWKINYEGLGHTQILRLDIGYLGYANTLSGGHDTGDKYKKALADITGGKTEAMRKFLEEKKIELNGYVTDDGDEYAIIANCPKDQAKELAEKIQAEALNVFMGPGALLPPGISVGYVSSDEFVDEFTVLFNAEGFNPGEFAEKYGIVLSRLADFKSEYNKYFDRLKLLRNMHLMVKSGVYSENYYQRLRKYVIKGAIDIAELELDKLTKGEYGVDEPGSFVYKANEWIRGILEKRNAHHIMQSDQPIGNFVAQKEREIIHSNNF